MKVLLVAGGTAGHMMPALAVARELSGNGSCLMLSTSRAVDQALARDSGVDWLTVDLERFTPLSRWLSPPYFLRQLSAMSTIRKVIQTLSPDVVVGFGGYVSAVGVAAARLSGVPAVIHEQNLLPGRANRWAAPFCYRVAVSFDETRKYLPARAAVEVTGNPIRPFAKGVTREEARASLGLAADRDVVLVMGGSQGSSAINRSFFSLWGEIPFKERGSVQVLHLTGEAEISLAEEVYRRLSIQARVFPFLKEMDLAYQAATLAVCRAGATTLAELIQCALPAILIPYPYAGGHQRANARWMESLGGAVVLEEKDLTPHLLWAEIKGMLSSPSRLARMKELLRERSDGEAAKRMASLIRRAAGAR